MSGWLEGKVALVTGASSGIGLAVAERFLREGASVCGMDRSARKIEELARRNDGRFLAHPGDVTVFEDNAHAVEQTLRSFGRLDCFVANAGIFDFFAPIESMSVEQLQVAFDRIFAVNVKGGLLGAKAAIPTLKDHSGSIIFTISMAGFYPDGGGVLYTASKHGVLGALRQLALELAPTVRVNGVAPGGTTSELSGPDELDEFRRGRLHGEQRVARLKTRNPLRIAQTPDDHAAAYVLLASDQSRAMTGTVIHSDGGTGVRGNPHYD